MVGLKAESVKRIAVFKVNCEKTLEVAASIKLKDTCTIHHLMPWSTVLLEKLIAKKFSALFWKTKVHHRIHKIPPVVPILSQIHPAQTFPPYFPTTQQSNKIFHLCLGLPHSLLPSGFPTKILYTFLISPMSVTFLLDFITLVILHPRVVTGE
jgi:hypothetical protein